MRNNTEFENLLLRGRGGHPLLSLQQSVGNREVSRRLASQPSPRRRSRPRRWRWPLSLAVGVLFAALLVLFLGIGLH